MARKSLKNFELKKIRIGLRHLSFRIISRIVLSVVIIIDMSIVSWVLWQVFFAPAHLNNLTTPTTVDLLIPEHIEELRLYAEDTGEITQPSSPFPDQNFEPNITQ